MISENPDRTIGRMENASMAQRRFVKVARMRIADVEEGDVVNARPDNEEGWFAVAKKHRLFNGQLQLSDYQADKAISADDFEIVGVQFVSDAEVPDQPPIPEKFLIFDDGSGYSDKDPESAESSTDGEPAEDANGEAAEGEPAAAAAGAPAPNGAASAQPVRAGN